MKSALRKEPIGHQTGYLGTSRVVLNQFDVSTQADIQHQALNYSPEDEIMGRLYGNEKRIDSSSGNLVAHYSKQDILEQYCISERGLGALENGTHSIFGCLSSYQNSPCSARNASSLLTSCVRQKVSSDENLYELYKKHQSEYAPFPKLQRYPWSPISSDIYSHDQDLKSSYFRRKPYADPSRYTWMPADDESVKMEKPKSIIDISYKNQVATQSKKHVSFARSHTLTSFDDAMSWLSSSSSHLNRITRSQERLLEVRMINGLQPITKQPEFSENKSLLDKMKRGPMKTQATQTDIIGKRPVPLTYIHLSPRTIQRVKMVSQAAQTNGLNGRKLIKSLSEAGNNFLSPSHKEAYSFEPEHGPLQRTQSDEPPRSPFIVTSPPDMQPQDTQLQSETSSLSKSEDHESEDSVETKKEIFIDFKPQVTISHLNMVKRPLVKTSSDGAILLEKRKSIKVDDCVVPIVRPYNSISHENLQIEEESLEFIPYFQKAPIQNEGIYKPLEENIYSSLDGGLHPQDSIDEEFHETIIYNRMYERSESLEADLKINNQGISPIDESVVPSIYLRAEMKLSPFASNDSLANDGKDQSDEIWNESQVTVLQIDSGTDNGTALSNSEIIPACPIGSTILLTPSSRRKHLLMLQHQQRSSIDTETLDEEPVEPITHPKIVVDKVTYKSDIPTVLHTSSTQMSSSLKVSQQRTFSPSRRRNISESPPVPAESPLPAVVPELILARTDSCKTNTDLSESTTTDDYITANSGTDSSRKSTSCQGFENQLSKQNIYKQPKIKTLCQDITIQEGAGSSFESAKGSLDIFMADDMVVPSISPSFSPDIKYLPEEQSSVSRPCHTPVPQIRTGRSTPSEDSSSCGSYSIGGSTPDLLERYSVPSGNFNKNWSDDEERSVHYSSSGYYESPLEDESVKREESSTKKKRREFHLDLTGGSKLGSSKSKSKSAETKISPPKNLKVTNDKVKRSKGRTRSPMHSHKKYIQGRKSPHKDKTLYSDDRNYKVTSDESSTGREYSLSQISPRKAKKSKENTRRKSLPRSPTSQKKQKKPDVVYQPSSLPGSLSRRKSTKSSKSLLPENLKDGNLSQHSKTLDDQKIATPPAKEPVTLKALSAESLRSVSPGSDSVFYSDLSSHIADQLHCLHCGKEVEVHKDDQDKHIGSNDHQTNIVQPPAGFEDSPKAKVDRLFRKSDRRLKSEEKGQSEHRRHRYRPDMRAKSEERSGGTATLRGRLRPMQRSPYCSKEQLKAADSSPCILPGAPEEDNDQGLYIASYIPAKWFCINEVEKIHGSFSPTDSEAIRRSSISSTESEHDLCKRYQSITHRIIHRKPYVEMYKRLHFKTFECDKTIVVQRDSGEFGFRIHGSKPVVVTAIESGTPAETSGLEVGDIILTVNGINVLERSHSDVVQIAHAGSDTLKLEVARTSYDVNSVEQSDSYTIYSGYLWKMSGNTQRNSTNKWIRRWFCLKTDNCLYCYKTDNDKQPIGVTILFDQTIRQVEDEGECPKPNKFVITRGESVQLYLAADTVEARSKWIEITKKTIDGCQGVDNFLEDIKKNLALGPTAISNPDCFGYLIKLGTQWKSWSRRYCVLKDAALYFYNDFNGPHAFGVALLQGYKVQQSLSSKKHAFEIIPPDPDKKHYYFHAESDTDKKRWMSALEYCIDRWLRLE